MFDNGVVAGRKGVYHFIISGKDSPRRDHMKCEFSKIGIEPHFFDAIMGRDLSEEELHQIAKPNTFLGVGEIGCAASHLGVYREFLQSEEPSVFIFEDDVLIPEKEYLPVFQDAKAWMDSLERPSLLVFQKSRYHKTFVKHLSMGVDIHSARNLFFTFGYLLNRKAAQNILRAQTPIRFEIDAFKFYYWLDFCDLYCLNQNVIAPAPISHDSVIEAGGGSRTDDTDRSVRKRQKDRAYHELYQRLPLKRKLLSQWRRLDKALHKLWESEEY